MKKLIYLASPYSHPDEAVRLERFEAVNRAAGNLMREGKLVFSPISHTHPIALAGDLPLGWEFWEAFDRAFIEQSQALYVLMLPGWQESTGVRAEIGIAEQLGIPICYWKPVGKGLVGADLAETLDRRP